MLGIEALWTSVFVSNAPVALNAGAGIVIFDSGRVMGGDSAFVFTGKYNTYGGVVTVEVDVKQHSTVLNSIFGDRKKFKIKASGKIDDNQFVISGEVVGEPDLKITLRLTRCADLP